MNQEKEWWENEDAWWYEDMNGHMQPRLSFIVAEASRRAKLEAWEEARDLIHRDLEATKRLREWESRIHNEYIYGLFQAYRLLDSRVRSLSRSWKE